MNKKEVTALSSKKKGSILAYSLIVLSMMLSIAVAISSSTIIEKKSASATSSSVQALQTADSGAQLAIKTINASSNLISFVKSIPGFETCSGGVIKNFSNAGAGTYDLYLYSNVAATSMIDCNADRGNKIKIIKSVATYNGTARSVSVNVGVDCAGTIDRDGIRYGKVLAKDGKCWLDRNLGAVSYPYSVISKNDIMGYGWLFQWGRSADGHQIINPALSGEEAGPSAMVVPGNKFLTMQPSGPLYHWSWYNGINPDRAIFWQGVSGINNPCPLGFRLPRQAEWGGLMTVTAENITNNTTAFTSSIKLTSPGWRRYDGGSSWNAGNYGYYWASDTPNNIGMFVADSGWNSGGMATQAVGYSVRCIAD